MKYLVSFTGLLLVLFGIYLSIALSLPHFFTPFSLGLGIIAYQIYNTISEDKIFYRWKMRHYLFFISSLTGAGIIIDRLGLAFGYWEYQYVTLFDEVVKYLFEWTIPLIASMIFFMIGIVLFQRKMRYGVAFIFSLLTFVLVLGFFTEYINHFSDSWKILSMPITSYAVGGYFIVFQTIGYWLMALIPFILYKVVVIKRPLS